MPQAYYLAERLLVIAWLSYLGSVASSVAFAAAPRRPFLERLASWLALCGLALHTLALAARWVANGQMEVYQQALAQGHAPATFGWLWTALCHPPWANLYESLLVTAWALMLCGSAARRRLQLRPLGPIAATMAALVLSVAFLVSDREVSPLAPALQSHWILAHVGPLLVSYSLFALAAGVALLFLLKADVPTPRLGEWLSAASALLVLLAGGGWSRIPELVLRGAFSLPPAVAVGSRLQPAFYLPPGGERPVRWYVELPGVGIWLLSSVALLLAAAVLFHRERRSTFALRSSWGARALGAGALAVLGGLVAMVRSTEAMQRLPASAAPGALAPAAAWAEMAMTDNQYGPAVLLLVAIAGASFLVAAAKRSSLTAALPGQDRLDEIAYRAIAVGFSLLSLGIFLGAVWAQQSWGRYWGWDPKEVWALVTWLVYAAYLHTRVALGWAGKPGAVIAVAGFALVVFAYLGVNLGLVGEGLHAFGAG